MNRFKFLALALFILGEVLIYSASINNEDTYRLCYMIFALVVLVLSGLCLIVQLDIMGQRRPAAPPEQSNNFREEFFYVAKFVIVLIVLVAIASSPYINNFFKYNALVAMLPVLFILGICIWIFAMRRGWVY
jgi:hypothetical protein